MNNDIVFNGKTFADVLSEIHYHATSKREMINAMIAKLVVLVHTPEDASIVFPIIQDFMDTAVKNDAHVVQIAQIIQKLQAISLKADASTGLLSETEKSELLRLVQKDTDELSKDAMELLATKAVDTLKSSAGKK